MLKVKGESIEVLRDMVARRWCLNPEAVEKVLNSMNGTIREKHKKIMAMGYGQFTNLCLKTDDGEDPANVEHRAKKLEV